MLSNFLPWVKNPAPRTIKLFCFVLGVSKNSFAVEIEDTQTVADLKEAIAKKKPITFANVEVDDLTLWQVSITVDRQLANKISNKEFSVEDALLETERLSSIFPVPEPIEGDLHVVIRLPPAHNIALRPGTVEALYKRLQAYGFIEVRGTPGSGKTTLGQLLAQRILKESNKSVVWVSEWPREAVEESGGYYVYLERLRAWGEGANTVFIFDEAQLSYWDTALWRDFFMTMGGYDDRWAIALASYGTPASRIVLEGTSIDLIREQRVTLAAIPHDDDIPPVGLLLSKDEMAEFISVLPESHFDPSFFDALFVLTGGHVGAIHDFVKAIAAHSSYRELEEVPGQLYTWERFMSMVIPRDLLNQLKVASVFTRGLPLVKDLTNPILANVFSAVFRAGYVTDAHFTSDALDTLQLCFRNGWLHSDQLHETDQGDVVAYFFSSSLHRWFLEWNLFDMLAVVPFQAGSILDFVITVISKFSSKQLAAKRRFGPGGIQRPLGAQYQDEFYRTCHSCSNGSVITFPEFGITKEGRVDFYIPAKKWGVELVRNGDRFQQHSGRFSQKESYMTALPVSDYIILDCCTTRPRDAHPALQKLYRVVFGNNFRDVTVFNNMLEPVDGGIFTLSSS